VGASGIAWLSTSHRCRYIAAAAADDDDDDDDDDDGV